MHYDARKAPASFQLPSVLSNTPLAVRSMIAISESLLIHVRSEYAVYPIPIEAYPGVNPILDCTSTTFTRRFATLVARHCHRYMNRPHLP
jgi:hypothetical protein